VASAASFKRLSTAGTVFVTGWESIFAMMG